MVTTITKKDLREVVKESVRDVLTAELMKFRALTLPYVSPKEQREIEKTLRLADRVTAKKLHLSL